MRLTGKIKTIILSSTIFVALLCHFGTQASAQTGYKIYATPTSLSFSVSAGAAATTKSIKINDTTPGPLPFTVFTDQPWIKISATSGNTAGGGQTMQFGVNAAGLAAGSYSGHVYLTASGVANSPQAVPMTLTVTPGAAVAPAITAQPSSKAVIAGQTATFTVVATGTAPMTYQWTKNAVAIGGAASSSYTTPVTTTSDNTAQFAANVNNSAGNTTSNSATLTVTSGLYSVSGFVSPPTSGTSTTLMLSGATSAIATADSSGNYAFTGLVTGNYTVTPTKIGYTFSPMSAQVSVTNRNVSVTTFAATANSTTQSLFTTQVPGQVGQSDGATVNYELGTLLRSNTTGQIAAIRFWKDAKESGTHTGHIWSSTGQVLASIVFANETASGWQQQALTVPLAIAANTTYVVSVNTGNSSYVDTVSGLASQVINGNLSSVVGNDGVYGPIGAFPTSSWQASNYFRDVLFVPSNGSVIAPAITTQPVNQSVNVGQTAAFNVAATGTLPVTYQWKKNSTAISGATSSTYTTPATTSSDNASQFTVVLTNSAGTATSATATLTVNTVSVAPAITAQPSSKAVIAGQTATFTVVATGTAPMTYQWTKNAVAIGGAASSSYTTPAEVTSDNNAQFAVHVTNSMGNATSTSATLTVTTGTLLLNSSASSLAFGNVNVSSSATKSVTLTNAGNSDVTVSGVSVSGPGFNASGVSGGLILTPGQTAALTATFTPSAAGSMTGNVAVASNATNSPDAIALSGTGVAMVSHSAFLSWTASTSTVVGYNVYSSTTSGGPYTPLTSSPSVGTSYTDSTVQAGLTYYYVVTAVASGNVESVFSNEISGIIP
jgi:hypothetical protein